MFGLSRRLFYAIEAVLFIAYHSGGAPVQSREIARRQGIPHRYLEQVLQQLVRERVLEGVRGPRGGYRLARERRRITVGDITQVVRTIEAGADPCGEAQGSDLACNVLRPFCAELQTEMAARLDRVTIDELCLRARDAGVPSDALERLDFTI
jgi:Rrf2 family protein